MGSVEEYNASVPATRAVLSQRAEIAVIMRFATLAANGHNNNERHRVASSHASIV